MKTLTITFALIISSFLSFAQNVNTQSITVTINNVKSDTGKVILTLHNQSTFMKTPEGVQSTETTIKDGKISITFNDVAPGNYAIMALHDENENKNMDFDTNRMPLESYGMSNNPMSFGPPQYKDAEFEIKNKDITMAIRF